MGENAGDGGEHRGGGTLSKSWEAGEQGTTTQWVLNELSGRSLGSGQAGGPSLPAWHGGFVVAPTPTAAAGRNGAVPSAASLAATSGAPMGRPRPLGCAGGRGGARSPRAGGLRWGGWPEQVEGWRSRGRGAAVARPLGPELQRPALPSLLAPMPARLLSLPEPLPVQLGFGGRAVWGPRANAVPAPPGPGRSPPHPPVLGAPLPSLPREPVPEERAGDPQAKPTEEPAAPGAAAAGRLHRRQDDPRLPPLSPGPAAGHVGLQDQGTGDTLVTVGPRSGPWPVGL